MTRAFSASMALAPLFARRVPERSVRSPNRRHPPSHVQRTGNDQGRWLWTGWRRFPVERPSLASRRPPGRCRVREPDRREDRSGRHGHRSRGNRREQEDAGHPPGRAGRDRDQRHGRLPQGRPPPPGGEGGAGRPGGHGADAPGPPAVAARPGLRRMRGQPAPVPGPPQGRRRAGEDRQGRRARAGRPGRRRPLRPRQRHPQGRAPHHRRAAASQGRPLHGGDGGLHVRSRHEGDARPARAKGAGPARSR